MSPLPFSRVTSLRNPLSTMTGTTVRRRCPSPWGKVGFRSLLTDALLSLPVPYTPFIPESNWVLTVSVSPKSISPSPVTEPLPDGREVSRPYFLVYTREGTKYTLSLGYISGIQEDSLGWSTRSLGVSSSTFTYDTGTLDFSKVRW